VVLSDFAHFIMRTLTKPSTAKCTLEHYTAFLLAESQSAGCVRLSEVSGGEFAHDAANRFLNREEFSPRDLFEEVRSLIDLEGGILSVDDTVQRQALQPGRQNRSGGLFLQRTAWQSRQRHQSGHALLRR
jgi:hypothetical protein